MSEAPDRNTEALRDWYAGMALQGHVAHHAWNWNADGVAERVAELSFTLADAMLKARSQ